jgi:hypothetical protein
MHHDYPFRLFASSRYIQVSAQLVAVEGRKPNGPLVGGAGSFAEVQV